MVSLPYEYEPLPNDDCTRLLELMPGAGSISCKLMPTTMGHAAGRYEALSYVWGDPSKTFSIECDGKLLSITQNLHDFLLKIRGQDEPRIVWADAICINQKDKKEQGHQVKRMDKIYKNAKQVLIWIGKDHGTAKDCFKFVVDFNRYFENGGDKAQPVWDVPIEPHDPVLSDQKGWNSVRSLLDQSWFKRTWILQEIGLAAHATVFYGDHSINWCELAKFTIIVELRPELHAMADFDVSLVTDTISDAFVCVWNSYGNPRSWRAELTELCERLGYCYVATSFITVLQFGRRSGATDPRDHIYGFLGHPFARLLDGNHIVDVNYNKSVDEVYFEAACALIKNGLYPWTVLAFVDHLVPSLSLQGSRPSWVPRWDESMRVAKLGDVNTWYRAGGNEEYRFNPTVHPDRSLGLHGFIFDSITWSSDMLKHDDFIIQKAAQNKTQVVSRIDSLWQEVEAISSCERYQNDQCRRDAFSLVLMRGRDPTDQSNPQEDSIVRHRQRFEAYQSAMRHIVQGERLDSTNIAERMSDALELQSICRLQNRRFFTTKTGFYGVGHYALEIGDICCIFLGADVPFIIRPATQRSGCYKLVTDAYIQGVMKGELIVKLHNERNQEEDILLI